MVNFHSGSRGSARDRYFQQILHSIDINRKAGSSLNDWKMEDLPVKHIKLDVFYL
jgi:hypothetical protein